MEKPKMDTCVPFTFAVCLLGLIISAGGQRVVITPQGNQMTTTESDVTLTCTLVDYTPPPYYRKSGVRLIWHGPHSQEIATTDGRIYIVRPERLSLRLHLTRIEAGDGGRYRCKATDPSTGLDLSSETNILVYEDIRFAETPTLERHLLGSNALLQCRATGLPRPVVTWYLNNRNILPDGGKYVIDKNGLHISQLDLRDAGMYECRAEVPSNGNAKSRFISLDLLYPPVILRQPNADRIIKGQTASLHCRADGNPQVSYEWFRELKMSDMIRVRVPLAEVTETYTIPKVDVEDEGRYFCRVSNLHGSKEVHVDVKMMVPPSIKPLPAKMVLIEGQTLNVTCEASGTPVPIIIWNRTSSVEKITTDKQQLILCGKWLENLQPGMNALTIRDLDRAYTGFLQCSARNLAGLDTRNIPLTVEFRPSISVDQPEQFGWSGETRSFKCMTDGVPPPTVTWFREERYIQNSSFYQITNSQTDTFVSTLTLKLPTAVTASYPPIYGTYHCVAKNIHGFAREAARLVEAVTPDMLRNVSVLEETPNTVTLRATPPLAIPHLPFLSWMVKYELASDGFEQHTCTFNFSTTKSLVVNGLNPGTTYTFYLSVSNAVGFSNPLKFRVTTPRKLNFKEQSDVPNRGDDDDDFVPRGTKTGSEEAVLYYDESKTEILVDKSFMSNRDMIIILIAIAIGSLIVIVSIIMAVVCVAWRRKKIIHRHSTSSEPPGPESTTAAGRASSSSSTEPRDNRIMLLPIWQPAEDSLPDIVRSDCTLSAATTPKDRMKRRIPEMENQTLPVGHSGSLPYGSYPVKRPSLSTIQRQQRSFDEIQADNRAGDGVECFDLPPPPAFLLYPSSEDAGGIAQELLRRQAFNHGEVLDGYHSGDNVDDDIDQIDYTIRIPSVHSQIFKYS